MVYVPDVGESDIIQFLVDNTPGGITLVPTGTVTPPTTPHSVLYNLDKMGNRTSIQEAGGATGTRTYQPNVLNQYSSAEGNPVTNGNEHEIKAYQGVTYGYLNDEHLILASSSNATYALAYDALGRCVKRTLNNNITTYYVYDGEKPITEYNANGGLVGWNLYGKGVDEILQRGIISGGAWVWYYLQQDHEGSVTHVTNASGGIIEQYRYDAFGAPTIRDNTGKVLTASAPTISNRFMFTGRELAPASLGFYEYRARAYHPGLGRFMSEDPKGFVRNRGLGNEPANWSFDKHPDEAEFNLFRYCDNDPLDFVDAMGLADSATIEFVPPRGTVNWAPATNQVVERYVPAGSDAASLQLKGERGMVMTSTKDPATGDIHVQGTIIITTLIAQRAIDANKTEQVKNDEGKRVDKFREGVPIAQLEADRLARAGFKGDEAAAKKAVEAAARKVMTEKGQEGKRIFDSGGRPVRPAGTPMPKSPLTRF
jgi:RHS repeat-associated protein